MPRKATLKHRQITIVDPESMTSGNRLGPLHLASFSSFGGDDITKQQAVHKRTIEYYRYRFLASIAYTYYIADHFRPITYHHGCPAGQYTFCTFRHGRDHAKINLAALGCLVACHAHPGHHSNGELMTTPVRGGANSVESSCLIISSTARLIAEDDTVSARRVTRAVLIKSDSEWHICNLY
jgi:hypothetical protein